MFYFSDDLKIKVELPYGFVDFFDLFPILRSFCKKEIKNDKLPPFVGDSAKDSSLQILVNYIRNKKTKGKLKDKIIYYEGLRNPLRDKTIPVETISDKECFDLIKECIATKTPTYYQISSFTLLGMEQKLFRPSINFLHT